MMLCGSNEMVEGAANGLEMYNAKIINCLLNDKVKYFAAIKIGIY